MVTVDRRVVPYAAQGEQNIQRVATKVKDKSGKEKTVYKWVNKSKTPITFDRTTIMIAEKTKNASNQNSKKDGAAPLFYHGQKPADNVFHPKSIMNAYAAVNYHNIFSDYTPFHDTDHAKMMDDFQRNAHTGDAWQDLYIQDRKNPTIQNIIKWYNVNDPYGLRSYSYSDFIYLKWLNQIPLNRLITLRRYPMPTVDKMFSIGEATEYDTQLLGVNKGYGAMATAVTFASKECDNDLSNILKFNYGMKWEDKQADVDTIEKDTGLRSQLEGKNCFGADNKILRSAYVAMATAAKGYTSEQVFAKLHGFQGDPVIQKYGTGVLGPINAIDSVKIRGRGLTFSQSFQLNFDYELKSLKYINPRVAMMDILANFLMLTGNYGNFWGGMTRYHTPQGQIAPMFGNLDELRAGNYYAYACSLCNDVKEGFKTITNQKGAANVDFSFDKIWEGLKNIGNNAIGNAIGKLLAKFSGGEVGNAKCTQALLKGDPTGYWHLTIGNPLDPICTIGNLCVTGVEVSFTDELGWDDFPTGVRFTVSLEHGQPRDIGSIQSMFNAGGGRIYADIDPKVLSSMAADPRLAAYKGGGEPKTNRESRNLQNVIKTKAYNTTVATKDAIVDWLDTTQNKYGKTRDAINVQTGGTN